MLPAITPRTSSDVQGSCHGVFDCPADTEPVIQSYRIHPKLACPLRSRLRSAGVGYHATRSSVILLLVLSSPAAIFWRVVPFVVDSIERSIGRRFSHICQEGTKVIPSLADSNSSSAPFGIIRILGIETSLSHSEPGFMNLELKKQFERINFVELKAADAINGIIPLVLNTA